MDTEIDFTVDQHLMSIRTDGFEMGNIVTENGRLATNGFIGYNTYDNFIELIRGLQGHGISVDDFLF